MKNFWGFLISFALTLNTAVALDDELNVYPLPAVFISKDVKTSNKDFSTFLEKDRTFFIDNYLDIFYRYFPNATNEISDKIKYKTFLKYG